MEPPNVLTAHLLDTITDFQMRNGVDLQDDLEDQKDIGALYFETPASATDGPDGYAIDYSGDQCDPVGIAPRAHHHGTPHGVVAGQLYVGAAGGATPLRRGPCPCAGDPRPNDRGGLGAVCPLA